MGCEENQNMFFFLKKFSSWCHKISCLFNGMLFLGLKVTDTK